MSEPVLDTVDLRDEVDDLDELLGEGSVEVAARARRASHLEFGMVTIANVLWAVVGLVLWLPQAFRAVLGAALRVVHSALTHQESDRAIAGIRRVSRFYTDRFLRTQGGGSPTVGRRHEWRPLRLLFEIAWAAAFYLLVLKWWRPETFAPIGARLESFASTAWERLGGAAASTLDWIAFDPSVLGGIWLRVTATVLVAIGLGLLLGLWLGRRR